MLRLHDSLKGSSCDMISRRTPCVPEVRSLRFSHNVDAYIQWHDWLKSAQACMRVMPKRAHAGRTSRAVGTTASNHHRIPPLSKRVFRTAVRALPSSHRLALTTGSLRDLLTWLALDGSFAGWAFCVAEVFAESQPRAAVSHASGSCAGIFWFRRAFVCPILNWLLTRQVSQTCLAACRARHHFDCKASNPKAAVWGCNVRGSAVAQAHAVLGFLSCQSMQGPVYVRAKT